MIYIMYIYIHNYIYNIIWASCHSRIQNPDFARFVFVHIDGFGSWYFRSGGTSGASRCLGEDHGQKSRRPGAQPLDPSGFTKAAGLSCRLVAFLHPQNPLHMINSDLKTSQEYNIDLHTGDQNRCYFLKSK